ncbi:hypothetical protein F7725_018151 [Dissostichus mawsoni]|uniref:PiggyBac transposable element-derived protein domain-containing protein n=1 Tax=Dissostichus mawsoni TaxID=36200 RepID=A0A7J5XQQ7_DISMA|nr:hypothetical protein F7725_018151 [Dissostichus mawsoni]
MAPDADIVEDVAEDEGRMCWRQSVVPLGGTNCVQRRSELQIYADYFTCVPLVVKLLDRGIHYVGTARQVRLPNCNLEEEKSLKKKGRGSFDIRVEANHNICCQMV